MADSIREKILQNVKSELEGITVTGGYEITIKKVARIPSSPFEESDFPNIQVQDLEEEKADQSPVGYTSCDLNIQLQCWVKEMGKADLSIALNKLIADVEKKLHEDGKRNSLAICTIFEGSQLILSEQILPLGGVLIFLTVKYRHTAGNPYTQ